MSLNHGAPRILMPDEGSSSSGEDLNVPNGCNKRQSVTSSSSKFGKRNHKGVNDALVDAMLEIAAASKSRAAALMKNESQFSISHCIKVLDEIQDLDERVYFFALDLFENPNARETFISLKSERRLIWLQGKFNASANSIM
ncbi:hypothetical protein Syun_002995 [Stephania yunnanensis]|uniref:Uncharacterized protein n=1 Tax=Stephania yunnanensis TaxID=152371 RepID=A0AAP0L1V9_9MAGN